MIGGGGGCWPPPEGRDEGRGVGGASILGEYSDGGLVTGVHFSRKASAQFSVASPCDDGDGGPVSANHGDGGSRSRAVVHGETGDSRAGMEIGVNCGVFLNACAGPGPGNGMHGTVATPANISWLGVSVPSEVAVSVATMMEDVRASSVKGTLGSSAEWMADDSPPVLEPTRMGYVQASSVKGILGSFAEWMAGDSPPVLETTEMGIEVEMLSASPRVFCMGNPHGLRSSGHTFSASKTGPQGVCGNDQRKSFYVNEMGVGHDASLPGQGRTGGAWQRPRMMAMPPLAELGEFSVDGATVVLDPAEVEITSQRFAAALVGQLFGRRIPFNVLNGELKRRWAAHGNFKIITMAGDCFICFFECIQARDDVLRGGPWVILGQVLGIDVWTPAFSPGASFAFSTPVWVRMPCLPLYCWSSRNIGRIAAMVGEPLWLDGATADLERGSFARTCVRIDLAKPLKSGVWVEGPYGKFFQPFVYEGLSVFCCRCGRVGHKEAACTLVPPIGGAQVDNSVVRDGTCRIDTLGDHEKAGSGCLVQADKLTLNSGMEAAPPAVSVVPVVGMVGTEGAEEKGVGPWMMVERRRRSSKPGPSGGRLPRHLEQMKVGHEKSLLGPFHFAGSSEAGHRYSGLGGLRMAVPGSVYPIKNNL